MLFHLIKDGAFSPKSYVSIYNWHAVKYLKSTWKPVGFITEFHSLVTYAITQRYAEIAVFFSQSFHSLASIFAPTGELNSHPKDSLFLLLPIAFMPVCSSTGCIYIQCCNLTASRFSGFLLLTKRKKERWRERERNDTNIAGNLLLSLFHPITSRFWPVKCVPPRCSKGWVVPRCWTRS